MSDDSAAEISGESWPALSSVLFKVSASDTVISIVSSAGLEVDWNLTGSDDYSHGTRKRALLPRVHAAVSQLAPERRKRALLTIAAEIPRTCPALLGDLGTALKSLGWTLKRSQQPEAQTEEHSIMKRDELLQRLLLLQVRDGTDSPEFSRYSDPDQVYNAALLINDGYVEGKAIKGSDGVYVTAVMTNLTSKGHDFLNGGKKVSKVSTHGKFVSRPQVSAVESEAKKIFISHSSIDDDLARAIVDLLAAALHLRISDFLCTSVDGARLRGGDQADEVLRRTIREVPAFISLLTPEAFGSTYVLFELGARWGTGKSHIPLLGKGAGPDLLKEPLKSTNALNLSRENDLLQLVDDLGGVLSLTQERPNAYMDRVRRVEEISKRGAISNSGARAQLLLSHCMAVIRRSNDLQTSLQEIRTLQDTLQVKDEQVSIVVGDRVELHVDQGTQGTLANQCWKTEESGSSLYPTMKSEGRGLKTARIQGTGRRMTTVAFETIDHPSCLVVAESHYYEKA